MSPTDITTTPWPVFFAYLALTLAVVAIILTICITKGGKS